MEVKKEYEALPVGSKLEQTIDGVTFQYVELHSIAKGSRLVGYTALDSPTDVSDVLCVKNAGKIAKFAVFPSNIFGSDPKEFIFVGNHNYIGICEKKMPHKKVMAVIAGSAALVILFSLGVSVYKSCVADNIQIAANSKSDNAPGGIEKVIDTITRRLPGKGARVISDDPNNEVTNDKSTEDNVKDEEELNSNDSEKLTNADFEDGMPNVLAEQEEDMRKERKEDSVQNQAIVAEIEQRSGKTKDNDFEDDPIGETGTVAQQEFSDMDIDVRSQDFVLKNSNSKEFGDIEYIVYCDGDQFYKVTLKPGYKCTINLYNVLQDGNYKFTVKAKYKDRTYNFVSKFKVIVIG
ncbi:hypothetical protein AALB53_08485 [Lachnospiraceae bacterium 47-T17]